MWCCVVVFFFFKQKTAYEMRISDWSSDVCSSDLARRRDEQLAAAARADVAGGALVDAESVHRPAGLDDLPSQGDLAACPLAGRQIGRASCRERVCQYV